MTEPLRGQQCSAKSKRSGERCKRLVLDPGPKPVCAMHGGKTPGYVAKRLERVAVAEAARFHGPVPVTGAQALLDELARTNGQVRAIEDTLGLQDLPSQEAGLVSRFMAERGHLKHVAEAVVRLDVDGKLLSVAELQSGQVAELIREVVLGLGLDPADMDVRTQIHAAIVRVDQRTSAAVGDAQQVLR